MNIDELIKQTEIENADFQQVGRDFFSYDFNNVEKAKLIKSMLEREMYNALCQVVESSYLNNSYVKDSYLNNFTPLATFETRFFNLFFNLIKDADIDFDFYSKMLVRAYYVLDGEPLKKWLPAIDAYLLKMAKVNYQSVFLLLTKEDKDYRCYGLLMRADKNKTVNILVDRLLFEKNIKKSAIRKFLLDYKIDISETLEEVYKFGNVNIRENIVRLLMLYKNDSKAAKFFDYISLNDKSETIQALIKKDATVKANKEDDFFAKYKFTEDSENCYCEIKFKKESVRIEIGKDFQPKTVREKPLSISEALLNEKLEIVKKEIEIKKQLFINAMLSGAEFDEHTFKQDVLSCALNSMIASQLFFSIYKNDIMKVIAVVEKGKICNLDNEEILLSDEKIRVLHVAEIPPSFEYIKRLNITQIIPQISRRAYIATDYEKSVNICSRLNGTILSAKTLKSNIKREGFKLFGCSLEFKYSLAGITIGNIVCAIEFTPTDFSEKDFIITLDNIRFYKYKDIIKLSGKVYLENAPSAQISEIDKRTFSELLYAVYHLANCDNS